MTSTLFTSLVIIMTALLGRALVRTEAVGGRPRVLLLAFLLLYLALPGILAVTGRLDHYDAVPPPALLQVVLLTAATIAFAFSPSGARLGAGVPLAALVGFQVFRVPVELLLHRLYMEQAIPQVMTYSGRNFDIVSGLTGGVLGVWLIRHHVAKPVLLLWNLLGLALLTNIIVIAVLATPTPMRAFLDGPPNLLPSTYPYVWLPSFLVQLALLGHLLLFRRLRSRP